MDRPGSSSTNDSPLLPGEAIAGEQGAFRWIGRELRATAPESEEARQRRYAQQREQKEKEHRRLCDHTAGILRTKAGTIEIIGDHDLAKALHAEADKVESGDLDNDRVDALSDRFHRAVSQHFTRTQFRAQSRRARHRATRVQRRTRPRSRGRRARRTRSSTSSRGSPSDGPGEEPGPAARAVAHSAQALTTSGQA